MTGNVCGALVILGDVLTSLSTTLATDVPTHVSPSTSAVSMLSMVSTLSMLAVVVCLPSPPSSDLSLSLSLCVCLSLPLSPSLSLTHTHTHSHTHPDCLILTHTQGGFRSRPRISAERRPFT